MAYTAINGLLKIYDIRDTKSIFKINVNSKSSCYVTSMIFMNDASKLIVGTNRGAILVYNYNLFNESNNSSLIYDGYFKVNMIKLSPFNSYIIACAFENGSIKVIDLNNNNSLICDFSSFHMKSCTGVAFSPINKKFLASCALDGRINFFDISENK